MDDIREKLDKLIDRRKKYFLLSGVERKIYQEQFEKMQKEIMHIKLCLEIYQDELDIFEVEFDYFRDQHKMKICLEAEKAGEIRWLTKKYNPETCKAKYVAQAKGEVTDEWLRELLERQNEIRAGYIECPWPNKIERGVENEHQKENDNTCNGAE
jgi:hypothetical protein